MSGCALCPKPGRLIIIDSLVAFNAGDEQSLQAGPGVHAAANAKEDQPAVARPIGGRNCQAAPRINGTKIKKLAKAASHQQAQVDECLDRALMNGGKG